MKHLSFIRVAVLLALVVTVASCGMPLYVTDGYYEEAPVRRDVYRGNVYGGSAPVVYERDPYTGRYYEVSPYSDYRSGRYYDRRSSRYYNNDRYNNRYNNNSRYNNGYGNNNTYRNNPRQAQPQTNQQTPQQKQQEREEAREKILGNKRGF